MKKRTGSILVLLVIYPFKHLNTPNTILLNRCAYWFCMNNCHCYVENEKTICKCPVRYTGNHRQIGKISVIMYILFLKIFSKITNYFVMKKFLKYQNNFIYVFLFIYFYYGLRLD